MKLVLLVTWVSVLWAMLGGIAKATMPEILPPYLFHILAIAGGVTMCLYFLERERK